MSKQESIGLRLKKTFLGEEIIEDFSALNYLIDFCFPKYKLAVEIDELGHSDRDSVKENKRQTEIVKYLDCKFIIINPDEKDLGAYDRLGKIQTFVDTLKDEELKKLKDKIKELKRQKIVNRQDFKKTFGIRI